MQANSKKTKVIFCGMPDMASVCLNALYRAGFRIEAVIPPPDTNPTSAGFIDFAQSLGLEVFRYNNSPNTPEMINKIKAKNADIGVICSFDKLLKKDFLSTTKMGYINCHPSLLPDYRGANPYFHIINNGEKVTAVTLHFADGSFDTGEIIVQDKFMLEPNETIGTLFNRSNFMFAKHLVDVLNNFEQTGKIESVPQPQGDFIKAPKIANQIKINTECPAAEIERLVRAANPFYNAFLMFRGAPVRIYSTGYNIKKHSIEYGTISKITKDSLEIAVLDGFICPKVLQAGSWGIFDVKDFIKIFRPQTGELFN